MEKKEVAVNSSVATDSNTKHKKVIGNASGTGSSALNLNNKLNANFQQQHHNQQIATHNIHNNLNKKVNNNLKSISTSKTNSSQSINQNNSGSGASTSSCASPQGSTAVPTSTSSTTSSSASSTSSISSESKDTNFEFEDEWDIGGIPELLDDLDADIEKSSTAAQQQQSATGNESSATVTVENSGGGNITKLTTISTLTQQQAKTISNYNSSINENTATTSSSLASLPFKPASSPGTTKASISTPSTSISVTSQKYSRQQTHGPSIPNNSSSAQRANYCLGNSGLDISSSGKCKQQHIKNFKLPQQSVLVAQLTSVSIKNSSGCISNPINAATTGSPSSNSLLNSSTNSGSTLSSSTFAGFSKGGSLVSSSNSLPSSNSSSSSASSGFSGPANSNASALAKYSASGMSSQSGTGNSNSGNTSGVGGPNSIQSSQGSVGTSGGGKSNAKMSIDHQATLDKGLKMKIKRTKPGTKTSEAKHEIVKATEQQQLQQQQNGTLGGNSMEDSGPNSNSSSSTSTASCSSMGTGSNISGSSNSSSGGNNKKHLSNSSSSGSSSNQNSSHSSVSGGNSNASGATGNSNAGGNGSTPQSNKRGSSGHRRDKTKEKTTHSNRLAAEKAAAAAAAVAAANEKDSCSNSSEKSNLSVCQCNGDTSSSMGGLSNGVPCGSHVCIRRPDNGSQLLAQRLNSSVGNMGNTNAQNSVIPPGVFTPSAGSPTGVTSAAAATAASLLAATSAANVVTSATTVNLQSGTTGSPNAPGPPSKDAANGVGSSVGLSGSNIKISSHIAAQLAAAAANSNYNSSATNAGATSASTFTDGKSVVNPLTAQAQTKNVAPGMISATVHHTISVPVNSSSSSNTNSSPAIGLLNAHVEDGTKSPPAKRAKHTEFASGSGAGTSKDMVDICIGTSVGTITEPDCLGPCEPGTSVTLEGIVWHETEGGVLVVNVTWRGKTYVGTLLDCTRHDWAPPRFCDSPTEELDSRTPKGRGKRGRSAALTPDLSNFTETRSSIYFSHAQVHSKLRNGASKGRGATRTNAGSTSTTTTTTTSSGSSSGNGGGATPSTSPTAFLPPRSEKRKSKDESPSPVNGGDSDSTGTGSVANASGIPISASGGGLATQPQSLLNPVTGLNVQINTKKCKTASPCAISPVLLECPEQDCSKKYKHANGLRYHQSHAHGGAGSMDEDSLQLPEEPPTTPSPVPTTTPTPAGTPNASASTNAAPTVVENSPTLGTPPMTASTPSSGTSTTTAVPPPPLVSQVPSPASNVSSAPESNLSTSTAMSINSPSSAPALSVPSVTSTTSSVPVNGGLLITTAPSVQQLQQLPPPLIAPTQPSQPQPLQPQLQQPTAQHSIAGGSITAGISGQVLSQQQQQQQPLSMVNTTGIPPLLSEQQQQALIQQGALKPGVLRFGPQNEVPASGALPSITSMQPQTSIGQVLSPQPNQQISGQNPMRPTAQQVNTEVTLQQHQHPQTAPLSAYGSTTSAQQPASQQSIQQPQAISLATKTNTSFAVAGKQKKNRKSPGPNDFDANVSRDDVQSPAYSDISDDSTPVGDQEMLDKSQPTKHVDLLAKKPQDVVSGSLSAGGVPPTMPSLGGYGMYQFYQQSPYMVPPPSSEPQVNCKGPLGSALGQSPLSLPTSQTQSSQPQSQHGPPHSHQSQAPPHHLQQQTHPAQVSPHSTDYSKNKDPPLDLMTKSQTSQQQQQSQEPNGKESSVQQPQPQPPVNLSSVAPPGSGLPPGLSGLAGLGSGVGPGGLPAPTPGKPLFYPFNYMSTGYPYNVEPNYGSVSIVTSEDAAKLSGHPGIPTSQPQSLNQHHQNVSSIKDERMKESPSPHENSKLAAQQQHQLIPNKIIKTEGIKQEIKQEPGGNVSSQNLQQQLQQQQPPPPQQPHAMHPKEFQALGASYPSIYQRHPMSLAAQHLSREEELRRYYIFSDQQRRQNAAVAAAAAAQQNVGGGGQPQGSNLTSQGQHKEDMNQSAQQHLSIAQQQQQTLQQHHQQQMHQQQQQHQQHQQQQQQQQQSHHQHKSKQQTCSNLSSSASSKATNLTKDMPKKQEEEVKVKQEGQKPTMETQGPPPPPTSQYFLHPSYISPAPFGFDPSHPMYRNVLMSAAGPYNAPPYHLPIPRYHAPEDLSRNTGTKALDALHHAASQYYTTHKIHELSERALKSPTSGPPGGQVKVSVSSPNIGPQPNSGNNGGSGLGAGNNSTPGGPNGGSHIPSSQPVGVSGSGGSMPLNLQPPSNSLAVSSNKQDISGQKSLGGGPGGPGSIVSGPLSVEAHKQQSHISAGPNSGGSGVGGIGVGGNGAGVGTNPGTPGNNSNAADSRSPPPQRHVHTHHHTHVGLGYPMYPAPYSAAVLASQQAAAVAVINPFPPGPAK